MVVIKGVRFAEQAGEQKKSPVFRFAPEAAQSQRSLFLPYTDDVSKVFAAAKALLGYGTVNSDNLGPGGSTRRWIERVTPASLAAFVAEVNPGLDPYLYCTSVPVAEPYSRPTGTLTEDISDYDWWRFATVWETLGYDVKEDSEVLAQSGPLAAVGIVPARPDEGERLAAGGRAATRYVTRQADPGSHTQSFRSFARFAVFEGHPDAPVPEGYTTTVARCVIRYTQHAIPGGYDGLPWLTILGALGTINNAVFDSMPIGCALYSDVKLREYRDAFGQRVFDATHTMIFRPLIDPVTGINFGWAGIYRVFDKVLRVWPVSADGNVPTPDNLPAGRALKAYSDFAALFRPRQG